MGNWFHQDSDEAKAHDEVTNATEGHKAKLSHQLIAGAASYEAMKAYNEHVKKNGKPSNHEKAKELLAGFAGAFVDHMVETKGLDFIDKQKAKKAAEKQLHDVSSSGY